MAEEVTVAGLGNCRRYAIVETAVSVTSWKQCSVCLRAERHYSLLWRAAREQYAWKQFYALITESYGAKYIRSKRWVLKIKMQLIQHFGLIPFQKILAVWIECKMIEYKNFNEYFLYNQYSHEIINVHSRERRNDEEELLVRGLSMKFSEPTSSIAAVRTWLEYIKILPNLAVLSLSYVENVSRARKGTCKKSFYIMKMLGGRVALWSQAPFKHYIWSDNSLQCIFVSAAWFSLRSTSLSDYQHV